jgi:hypothetical protein
VRGLLHRRHRQTTILISRPSCAGRQTENCYSRACGKGPDGKPPGPFLFGVRVVIKRLILNG